MEHLSRKQRQQELREAKSHDDLLNNVGTSTENTDTIIMSDDVIFKEQKKRLRRQLNSVPSFTIESEDMKVAPNTMMTRTEIKKQKKIDEILKDIAVLPENEYLNEDTNLRILKKLSVAKKYNQLQLSPDQEEKMTQNKEKFETITNQLWFLIQELEKRQVEEPAIGTVPTVASKDLDRNKSRQFFDLETEKTQTIMVDDETQVEDMEMNTKIDILEEKLEKISLRNDELEGVLQELEKVVQEGKEIVQSEAQSSMDDVDNVPEDTLELIDYLNKLEKLNQTNVMGITKPEPVVVKNDESNTKLNSEVVIQPTAKKADEAQEDFTEVKLQPITTTIKPNQEKQKIVTTNSEPIAEPKPLEDTKTEVKPVAVAKNTNISEQTTANSDVTTNAPNVKTMETKVATAPQPKIENKTNTTAIKVQPEVITKNNLDSNIEKKPMKKSGLEKSIIALSMIFVIILLCLLITVAYFFWYRS